MQILLHNYRLINWFADEFSKSTKGIECASKNRYIRVWTKFQSFDNHILKYNKQSELLIWLTIYRGVNAKYLVLCINSLQNWCETIDNNKWSITNTNTHTLHPNGTFINGTYIEWWMVNGERWTVKRGRKTKRLTFLSFQNKWERKESEITKKKKTTNWLGVCVLFLSICNR